jgi:hypothetical protein
VLHSAEDDKPRLQRGKVAPELPVPEHIPRPSYAANYSHPPWTDQVMVHNQEGVAKMRESCRLAARVLQHAGTLVRVRPCSPAVKHHMALSAGGMLAAFQIHSELMSSGWPTRATIVVHMQPGVTTDEIDQAVHQMIVEHGAYPSPLRYGEAVLTAEHRRQNTDTNKCSHDETSSPTHHSCDQHTVQEELFIDTVVLCSQASSRRASAHQSMSAYATAFPTRGSCRMVTLSTSTSRCFST